ncbi:MAG: SPOR domain-containing protein [Firmicutes bacterium]|nr:SPOR domain-containing protein [Bacillota bacterium]
MISIFLGKWIGIKVMNSPPFISHTPKAMVHIPHIHVQPIQPVVPSPSLQGKETISSPPLVVPPPAPNNTSGAPVVSSNPQQAAGTQTAATQAAGAQTAATQATGTQAAGTQAALPVSAAAAPVPKSAQTSSKPNVPQGAFYKIQIGLFLAKGDAQAFEQKLQKQGYNALITPLSQKGDRFYQVWIGPFPTRSMAEIMTKQLIGSGYRAFVIKNVQ